MVFISSWSLQTTLIRDLLTFLKYLSYIQHHPSPVVDNFLNKSQIKSYGVLIHVYIHF